MNQPLLFQLGDVDHKYIQIENRPLVNVMLFADGVQQGEYQPIQMCTDAFKIHNQYFLHEQRIK